MAEAITGALWSGPTGSFLSAFAVELGAGGGMLGLLLALNTFLANGLQLQGAQWTRRGHTDRRVYLAAITSRGTWLLAGVLPAWLALSGRPQLALTLFLIMLALASIATAAANPAMSARAGTAAGERGRTRYLADRMMALWLGALLGTAGMTLLLGIQPGPLGYAIGFGIASAIGLAGLGAYAMLLRRSEEAGLDELKPRGEGVLPPPLAAPRAERLDSDASAASPASTDIVPGPSDAGDPAQTRDAPSEEGKTSRPHLAAPPQRGWWYAVSRRLGAPSSPALGRLVIAAGILQGGASMVGPASPIWLVNYLEAPTSFLGIVSLASSLTAIASQRVWARLIDRLGAERVLGLAATGAAFIPVGWMLVWQPWIAIAVSAYGGMAWGGYQLAMTSRLLQMAPIGERPAYLGTYAAAVGAAGAIGSLLAGAITAAVPIPWIPVVFFLSFLTRSLGWFFLSRPATPPETAAESASDVSEMRVK